MEISRTHSSTDRLSLARIPESEMINIAVLKM